MSIEQLKRAQLVVHVLLVATGAITAALGVIDHYLDSLVGG